MIWDRKSMDQKQGGAASLSYTQRIISPVLLTKLDISQRNTQLIHMTSVSHCPTLRLGSILFFWIELNLVLGLSLAMVGEKRVFWDEAGLVPQGGIWILEVCVTPGRSSWGVGVGAGLSWALGVLGFLSLRMQLPMIISVRHRESPHKSPCWQWAQQQRALPPLATRPFPLVRSLPHTSCGYLPILRAAEHGPWLLEKNYFDTC